MPDDPLTYGQNCTVAAGISVCQGSNIDINDVVVRDCRIDGISLGYSTHGGTYHSTVNGARVTGSGRAPMVFMTGFRNSIVNNNFDGNVIIEPNQLDEVAAETVLSNNHISGSIQINTPANAAKCYYTRVVGNYCKTVAIYTHCGHGSVVVGNSIVGDGTTTAFVIDWINSAGEIALPGLVVANNNIRNHARGVAPSNSNGTLVNTQFIGNSWKNIASVSGGEVLFDLRRAFNVAFENNNMETIGHVSTPDTLFAYFYSHVGSNPYQGHNRLVDNKVHSDSPMAAFVQWSWGNLWPAADNIFDFVDSNEVVGPYATAILYDNTIDTPPTKSPITNNYFNAKIDKTTVPAGVWVSMSDSGTSKATQLVLQNNVVVGYATGIEIYRPYGCYIVNNVFDEVELGMLLTYDSDLAQGANTYLGNVFKPGGTDTYGVYIAAGPLYNAAFVSPDFLVNNMASVDFATANYDADVAIVHTINTVVNIP